MCGCSFPDNSVHMTVGRFSAPDEWVLASTFPFVNVGHCVLIFFLRHATKQLTIVVIIQQNRGGQLTSRRPYIFRELSH